MTDPITNKSRLTAANEVLKIRRSEVRRVVALSRHRNGVDGAPFHAVLFRPTGHESGLKLGVVFDKPAHVAVLDVSKLAQGNIEFGKNSWRGDWYEPGLRAAILGYDALDLEQTP